MSLTDDERFARAFAAMASRAGAAILEVRAEGVETRTKADKSPVTEADERAEAILIEAVEELLPGVTIVAEERVAKEGAPEVGSSFILIDALDGTKEFVRGGSDFTVNIGYVEDQAPVFGFVYAPADGRFFFGGREGALAARFDAGAEPDLASASALRTRAYPGGGLTAVCSRSHLDETTAAFIDSLDIAERRSCGSSIKFCTLAMGEADVYPRFAPTCEWDTAAGHAVLKAAGGCVLNPDGSPFAYAKKDFLNGSFVAWGREPAPSRAAVG